VVDFAHTPGGLEALLRSVRELTDRRLVLVFGCGGERDRGKRPLMGKVAGELSDVPVITSDNPRREDPVQILADVEKGLKESGNAAYRLMPDRREAIQRAVRVAVRGEANGEPCVVVVAGKGHETTQDLGDRVIPFIDREELAAAIAAERTAGASGSGSQPAFVPTGERHG
jgi:UDP-N-acetylmuramoyl-L-alanyl-D-glutamate--2,6-diaminopimelate ligase